MELEGAIRGVDIRTGELMADATLMVDGEAWLTELVVDWVVFVELTEIEVSDTSDVVGWVAGAIVGEVNNGTSTEAVTLRDALATMLSAPDIVNTP